jgi:hypothetical protein
VCSAPNYARASAWRWGPDRIYIRYMPRLIINRPYRKGRARALAVASKREIFIIACYTHGRARAYEHFWNSVVAPAIVIIIIFFFQYKSYYYYYYCSASTDIFGGPSAFLTGEKKIKQVYYRFNNVPVPVCVFETNAGIYDKFRKTIIYKILKFFFSSSPFHTYIFSSLFRCMRYTFRYKKKKKNIARCYYLFFPSLRRK